MMAVNPKLNLAQVPEVIIISFMVCVMVHFLLLFSSHILNVY